MVSIENRKGEIRLLEQWIDGTSLESTLSEQEGWDVTASGFAWHLYQTCLKLLKNIIQTSKDTDGHTGFELRPLKECLSRFFLWGEGFGGGQLDKIIQRSDALKSTILQFIAAIAKILLDSEFWMIFE
jgi:quinol monooxygenase YgiN